MLPSSLSNYLEDIKRVIFDLGCCGFTSYAERLNRVVFESTWSSDASLLREVTTVLNDSRSALPEGALRQRVGLLETYARNYKRVFEQ